MFQWVILWQTLLFYKHLYIQPQNYWGKQTDSSKNSWKSVDLIQDFQGSCSLFLICSLLHLECFPHSNRKQATFYLCEIWVQGAISITEFHCLFSFLCYFTPNYIGLPKKKVLQFHLKVLLTSLAAWIIIKDKISKISTYHEE